MVKEVKKRSKTFLERSKNFYLFIYHKFQAGKRPSEISKELNISKQKLNYYIRFLKQRRIIEKKGYGTWEIARYLSDSDLQKEVKKRSKKIFSIGLRKKPLVNLHALQINFPILSGKIDDSDWKLKNKLKNWLPKYTEFNTNILGGLTIRNNNNKSLTVFAKTRNITNLDEIDNLAFKIKAYIHDYFKNKHNVTLDVFNCQTKNLNIATEDKESEDMIKKGERFEFDLNKQAEKVFPKDNIPGKAWIDGSPFKFSAETNDKEWKRAYLSMPFMMRDIATATHYIAQNYASHVKMVEQASNVLEKLNKSLKGDEK